MKKRIKHFFRREKVTSADLAKKRLQIIISADKTDHNNDSVMENFRKGLMTLIAENFKVAVSDLEESVKLDMGHCDGQSTLELNITLPNAETAVAETA